MGLQSLAVNAFGSIGKYVGRTSKNGFKVAKSLEGLKYDTTFFQKTEEKIGKHKVKRFLYHLTNKENYESMLKDGEIHKSKELIPGVFMTELPNLFKRWGKKPQWGGDSLKTALAYQAKHDGSSDLVLLKIPTEVLDKSKLVARSQEKLFSKYDELEKHWSDLGLGNVSSLDDIPQAVRDKFPDLFKGVPAKNSSLLKKTKHSIEYIYPESIPMSQVEKVGEANLREIAFYSVEFPERTLFTTLLKGHPEEKAASLLKS